MKFTVDPDMHREGCAFRKAIESSVGIECEHGFDVCPYCDPCTCQQIAEKDEPVPADEGDA